MATHYITDIEFDEVKNVVKFKTQDRMIKFKDNSYSGYKKIIGRKLTQIRNTDLISDIMNRALQTSENLEGNQTDEIMRYQITESALKVLQKRTVNQGYLDEMSIWSALQKACDMDLIHTYINRENVLIIDKNIQL